MIRTQVYLPEDQHKTLRKAASHNKMSMAELVRKYIDKGLRQDDTSADGSRDTMRALARMDLTGGPADLSSGHDRYLYGTDD